MTQTLVLNASYEPLRICSWERAICMWLDDRVEILATYSERVYDAIKDWCGKMPAVVRLLKYVSLDVKSVKFSRINVFGRDRFSCAYCGIQPGTANLTYDHVVPKSRGGKTCWNNIVTCCIECNWKKSDRTPEEAGMYLKSKPYVPKHRPLIRRLALSMPNSPSEWRSYLYWTQELENE
jgi:5-methylcytosine-specific restriction endonuclease McrA